MSEIAGWFSGLDAQLFALIAEFQNRQRLAGDILEIGAFEGKSAILLGYFLRAGEDLVVCDLFGTSAVSPTNQREADEWYAGLTSDIFVSNYSRFHPALPVIHRCASSDLASREPRRLFRLIHVDGSHQFGDVCDDIAYAKARLLPQGIIVLDDYRAAHAPAVAAAVWREIVSGDLIPFCATADKMYACWGDHGNEVQTYLRHALTRSPAVRTIQDDVMGFPLLIVLPNDYGPPHRIGGRLRRLVRKSIAACASARKDREKRLRSWFASSDAVREPKWPWRVPLQLLTEADADEKLHTRSGCRFTRRSNIGRDRSMTSLASPARLAERLMSATIYHLGQFRSRRIPKGVSARRDKLVASGLLAVGRFTYGCPDVRNYPGDATKAVIGSFCSIAEDVQIFVGGNHPVEWVSTFPFRAALGLPGALQDGCPASKGDVVIGNDVWIGAGATILSGVRIGNGAVVGAQAVVARDVMPYAIVVGNPAREVRRRFSLDQIEALELVAWWEWPIERILDNVHLLSGSDVERFLADCSPSPSPDY